MAWRQSEADVSAAALRALATHALRWERRQRQKRTLRRDHPLREALSVDQDSGTLPRLCWRGCHPVRGSNSCSRSTPPGSMTTVGQESVRAPLPLACRCGWYGQRGSRMCPIPYADRWSSTRSLADCGRDGRRAPCTGRCGSSAAPGLRHPPGAVRGTTRWRCARPRWTASVRRGGPAPGGRAAPGKVRRLRHAAPVARLRPAKALRSSRAPPPPPSWRGTRRRWS